MKRKYRFKYIKEGEAYLLYEGHKVVCLRNHPKLKLYEVYTISKIDKDGMQLQEFPKQKGFSGEWDVTIFPLAIFSVVYKTTKITINDDEIQIFCRRCQKEYNIPIGTRRFLCLNCYSFHLIDE